MPGRGPMWQESVATGWGPGVEKEREGGAERRLQAGRPWL